MTETRTSAAAPPDLPAGRARRVRGRPLLYTSYAQDMALLDTPAKRVSTGLLVVVAFALAVLLQDRSLEVLAAAYVLGIGAIGLNIVTGYAGQVSLGHAFFVAIGAYTAAALSGPPDGENIGYGVAELWIWLPAAGLVAAAAGVLVAPLATRLRGLYLAVVTLGLVFLGEHIFKEWQELTGGPGVGREAAIPQLFGVRLDQDGPLGTKEQLLYTLMLTLLLVFAVAARNLARSRIGRAFAAIRDRDIAAAVIGVPLARYKVLAFGISSFYAGCAGGLLFTISGYVEPSSFNLLLSVQFIAMVLIGGVATVSGAIAGALFISLLQPVTRSLPALVPFISGDTTQTPNVFQVETVLYGLLIVLFLIFEPRGLFGLWVRVRNYWKSWPFSY
ncbi:branched-chain amino acid ABC transporter permease [Nonomuraea gerenzanensis]|uniref:Branched-chain amino acid transport system permease protein LivM (TC 3.A.1.4.1) n=1 Tax=Nonomuraea gerenzanensis TaxID=93944 RepID=A0A1M4EKC0_9ACTN|nr:branched-chain amino acid ABC transporter permease [Nonomuraea gerenzanensis]UBU10572.1 branched-chain amino acid ABC transporter permease [Nonomuraea gerenzanensis]SBO98983.1 Branched-chain amino acid transport system permease protein LivM (TC 3.A.1.4.1) [Nonomuraea gerenzanensis]